MANDSNNDDAWWKTVGLGFLCLGIAIFLYWYFTDFETSGGRRRIHWAIAWLYKLGGKWVPSSIFALIGVCGIGLGLKEWKDRR